MGVTQVRKFKEREIDGKLKIFSAKGEQYFEIDQRNVGNFKCTHFNGAKEVQIEYSFGFGAAMQSKKLLFDEKLLDEKLKLFSPKKEPLKLKFVDHPIEKQSALKHIESDVKIYFTRDYHRFKLIPGNRVVQERKVKKLIKSIQAGNNLLNLCPCIVDSDMNILDGQHRYTTSVRLKENVFYVIDKKAIKLRVIADMNNNTDKWTNQDFLACYFNQGNADYIGLKEFIDTYGLGINTSIQLLGQDGVIHDGGSHSNEKFKDGNFKITSNKFAVDIAEKTKQFEPFSPDYKTRGFIIAIIKLIAGGKYDHDAMLKKLAKHDLKITKQTTPKNYLSHLEELFNFKNSKRVVLF